MENSKADTKIHEQFLTTVWDAFNYMVQYFSLFLSHLPSVNSMDCTNSVMALGITSASLLLM